MGKIIKNHFKGLVCASLVLFSLCAKIAFGAPSFTTGTTTAQMANMLEGPGLTISNPQISLGNSQQYGIMSGGTDTFNVENAIFLTTGDINSIRAPNNSPSYGSVTPISVYRDPDITAISSMAAYDPVAFEFDITPQGDTANFIFNFGSDEYPEFVCSQFNDAFAMFISGPGISGKRNAALLPDTNIPITVNNVNGGQAGSKADGTTCQLNNSAYFIDNGNGSGSNISQLDGYTKALTSSVTGLQPGAVYHVKLILADAGDSTYDSAAIFKWLTSTNSTPVDLSLSAGSNKPNPVYGSEVELTWTISNASNAGTKLVQATLPLPAGLTLLSDDSAGTYNATTGVWDAGTLPAQGNKSLTIRATVGSGTLYSMTGEITYAFNADPDSTPFNRHINPNEDDTATLTLQPVVNSAPALSKITSVSVPENKLPVTTIKATDINGDSLTYSITGGADANKFTINTKTGVLRFVTAPDFESPADNDKNNTYIVKITVNDGALSASQTITVNVADVYENALPFIIPGNNAATHTVRYPENNAAIVLNYNATDADGDTEGNGLTWKISGGADQWAFTLNSQNGQLELTGTPDFERPLDADKQNTYEVEVTVCDSQQGCSTQLLTVTVTDIAEDTDGDGLPDSAEIAAGTPDPYNNGKDTDNDGLPDYRDPDDDNDGILTQYESVDPNQDGNPADARDTDKDGTPDYLDPDDDNDGKPTNTELADPNGDGNPADADDMDDDGTPDYLDNNDEPSVRVSVRAYLQGPFDATTGLMSDALRTLGVLPKRQPYGSLLSSFGYTAVENTAPLNYSGTETIPDATYATNGTNAIVDWVLVELRDASKPATRVAIKAAVIQRDGDIVNAETGKPALTFRGTPPGNYYVAIRHRNHLGIMTNTPVSLANTATAIDFTKTSTAVYGTNQRKTVTTDNVAVALMWAGDANNSNTIIAQGPGSDALIILSAILIAPENTLITLHYQLAGYFASDLNMNGYTIYSGPDNDTNVLMGNIYEHPGNTHFAGNYIINGAIPY